MYKYIKVFSKYANTLKKYWKVSMSLNKVLRSITNLIKHFWGKVTLMVKQFKSIEKKYQSIRVLILTGLWNKHMVSSSSSPLGQSTRLLQSCSIEIHFESPRSSELGQNHCLSPPMVGGHSVKREISYLFTILQKLPNVISLKHFMYSLQPKCTTWNCQISSNETHQKCKIWNRYLIWFTESKFQILGHHGISTL